MYPEFRRILYHGTVPEITGVDVRSLPHKIPDEEK